MTSGYFPYGVIRSSDAVEDSELDSSEDSGVDDADDSELADELLGLLGLPHAASPTAIARTKTRAIAFLNIIILL